MKQGRMKWDASTQRLRANCAHEPVHETDPGMCRNHPLLGWREGSCRQQHVEEKLCSSIPMLEHSCARRIFAMSKTSQGGTRWRFSTNGVQAWTCIRRMSRC